MWFVLLNVCFLPPSSLFLFLFLSSCWSFSDALILWFNAFLSTSLFYLSGGKVEVCSMFCSSEGAGARRKPSA